MNSIQSIIKAACHQHGEVEFRDDYSGRSMYGTECIGITGSMRDCQNVLGSLISQLTHDTFMSAMNARDGAEEDAAYDFNDEVQSTLALLTSFEIDSMGQDNIMYWPGIKAEQSLDQSEE